MSNKPNNEHSCGGLDTEKRQQLAAPETSFSLIRYLPRLQGKHIDKDHNNNKMPEMRDKVQGIHQEIWSARNSPRRAGSIRQSCKEVIRMNIIKRIKRSFFPSDADYIDLGAKYQRVG